jgi:hypothetical protein
VGRSKRSSCYRQVRQRRNRVNFHLTSSGVLGLFVQINGNQNTTSDMKKLFVLSMLVPLAIVCSCQKQDAAAEQQLAQRKTELDAREKALDEREKALAERERAVARAAILPADLQLRALKKDGSSNVQPSASIPPGLSPPGDTAQLKASRERRIEELRALRQRRLEAIQKMRTLGAQANPGASADASASASSNGSADTGASASSGGEATSPSPSSTPQ